MTDWTVLCDRQDGQLITEEWTDMELDDVNLSPQFESILSDARWVDDATGECTQHQRSVVVCRLKPNPQKRYWIRKYLVRYLVDQND